ncbi:F0F1 ATP synthase subunit B [Candidatus Gottesmanbacteria bacterium]|nr:F0F1 ATP synthase subunit B [Candidatus Gottesmanbacteria bacterium]
MENLGIQPVQLLTQAINFLIMLFVLQKLLYKPIMKALEERRKKIEEGLNYTEKVKLELEKVEKKKGELLDEAKKEVRSIIEEGKISGKKVADEIIAKASGEAKEIVEKGKRDVEIERKEMETHLQKQMVEIAVEVAGRALSDVLSSTDQKMIIDKKLKKVIHGMK